jgi:DNA-binding NarL/FixJ family response regulator
MHAPPKNCANLPPAGGILAAGRVSFGGGATHPPRRTCRWEKICPPSPASPLRRITVVLERFDDLLARGLRALIAGDPGLEIVAEDIEQARISTVLRAHRPAVAVLDADGFHKLAAVRELSVAHPATRLVLLAGDLSSVESAQLLAFGASACLRRDTQGRDVLNAIHLAARGLQLTPRASGRSYEERVAGGQLLTGREADVLPLLRQGRSNPQIALELQVGVETVRTHARNIYRKLGVSSRRELTEAPIGATEDRSGRDDRRASPRDPNSRERGRDRDRAARSGDVRQHDS